MVMANQSRNSILCPNCRKLISADEPRCPYCGTGRPGSWWKNNAWTRGFRDANQLIKLIIYVNGGMFLLSFIMNPQLSGGSLNPLAFLSPNNRCLFFLGATGAIAIDQLQRWWTLIAANYLHAGLLHILFNMMALSQIAPLIIQEYGGYRMFTIYTLSGVLGFYVSYLAGVPFTVGASGAVCGLIGAALYYGKSRGGLYGQAVFSQIGGWALGIFLFGLLAPGINNWSHGAGILGGGCLGFLLGYNEKKRESLMDRLVSGACAVVTVLTLGWAVFSGIGACLR
jgi:rhomboid protease GluP